MNRALPLVFILLVLVALGQAAWQHGRLPDTVATHFDAAGKADGWMTRNTQTTWHVVMILFIAGLMEGIARLNARVPDEFVNIPRREYWLAPERREATHRWLRGAIRLIGCVLMLFFLGLYHQVYRANTSGTQMIAGVTGLLVAGCLLSVAAVTVAVFLRFNRKTG
jgi:uncharacterized membrane protein